MPTKPPVITIVGPTASGKTALSIALAKAFNGEIVSADSRQVYRGLDVGSAKVTPEEMVGIPHHLLDVADVHERYTLADYITAGTAALSDITSRGKLPIVAGGTFFYVQGLRGIAQPAPVPPNPTLRAELSPLSVPDLHDRLTALSPSLAKKLLVPGRQENPRRLIRTIEIVTALKTMPKPVRVPSPYKWHLYAIDVPLTILTDRIRQRIISRLPALKEEIATLLHNGVSSERLHELGLEYRYGVQWHEGRLTEPEFIDTLTTKSRQFAKRQYTWLRRESDITWLPFPVNTEDVLTKIQTVLAKP